MEWKLVFTEEKHGSPSFVAYHAHKEITDCIPNTLIIYDYSVHGNGIWYIARGTCRIEDSIGHKENFVLQDSHMETVQDAMECAEKHFDEAIRVFKNSKSKEEFKLEWEISSYKPLHKYCFNTVELYDGVFLRSSMFLTLKAEKNWILDITMYLVYKNVRTVDTIYVIADEEHAFDDSCRAYDFAEKFYNSFVYDRKNSREIKYTEKDGKKYYVVEEHEPEQQKSSADPIQEYFATVYNLIYDKYQKVFEKIDLDYQEIKNRRNIFNSLLTDNKKNQFENLHSVDTSTPNKKKSICDLCVEYIKRELEKR